MSTTPDKLCVHTIIVKCSSCGSEKHYHAKTKTRRKTKALAEAAINSRCLICGGK